MIGFASQHARLAPVDPKTRTPAAIYGSMVAAIGHHPVHTIRAQTTVNDPAGTWTRTLDAQVSPDAASGVGAWATVRYERWVTGTAAQYRQMQVIGNVDGITYITSDDWVGSLKGRWLTYTAKKQAGLRFGKPLQRWLDDGSLAGLRALNDMVPISVTPAAGQGWLLTGTIPAPRANAALGVQSYQDELRIDSTRERGGVDGDAVVHLRLGADYLPQHVEIHGDEIALEVGIWEYDLAQVQRRHLTIDFVDFGRPLTARLPDPDLQITKDDPLTDAEYAQI